MRRTKPHTKQKHRTRKPGGKWLGKQLHVKVPKFAIGLLVFGYMILGILAGAVILHELQESHVSQPAKATFDNTDGDASFQVKSIKMGEKGQTPFEAPAGESFVVVNVVMNNNSGQHFYFAPVLQTYISDASGVQYKMSPAVLDKPIEAGSVDAKQSVNGMLSYLVPDDATGLVLHFQPDQPNAKPLRVPL